MVTVPPASPTAVRAAQGQLRRAFVSRSRGNIGLGHGHDLGLYGGASEAQLIDLLQQQAQHPQQDLRNSFLTGRNQLTQLGKAAPPLRRGDAEFDQLAAHAVHQLGVLLEQQFPRPLEPARGLSRYALDRDKPHVRTADRRARRRRIAGVVLVGAERTASHMPTGSAAPRDPARLVPGPSNGRTRTPRCRSTRARAGKKQQKLRSAQPLLHNYLAACILAVNLEHRFWRYRARS